MKLRLKKFLCIINLYIKSKVDLVAFPVFVAVDSFDELTLANLSARLVAHLCSISGLEAFRFFSIWVDTCNFYLFYSVIEF